MGHRTSEAIQVRALSIASPAEQLLRANAEWRVVQLFDRSINLATASGGFISVNAAGIDPAPFSILVESNVQDAPSYRQVFANGDQLQTVTVGCRELQIGRVHIDLRAAREWNPLLPKGQLVNVTVYADIGRVVTLLDQFAPQDSLPVECGRKGDSKIGAQVRLAWGKMRQALVQDAPAEGRQGAFLAAGVGIGLTPSGDDFLVGVMLALWLAMKDPEPYIDSLIAGATGRTGQLSMALLKSAARGEAGQAWHHLVEALIRSDSSMLESSVHSLMSAGHTSGTDALFGFVVTLGTICQPLSRSPKDSTMESTGIRS